MSVAYADCFHPRLSCHPVLLSAATVAWGIFGLAVQPRIGASESVSTSNESRLRFMSSFQDIRRSQREVYLPPPAVVQRLCKWTVLAAKAQFCNWQ